MDHTSIDIYLVIDTFLLLLIGIGPKIALVPFLEVTAAMDGATKALVVRKMLITAGVVAVILVGLGELLARLLHFSTGSLSIAGGIILVIIAVTMVLGSDRSAGESSDKRARPDADRSIPARHPLSPEPGRDRDARDALGRGRLGRRVRNGARRCSRWCWPSTSPYSVGQTA